MPANFCRAATVQWRHQATDGGTAIGDRAGRRVDTAPVRPNDATRGRRTFSPRPVRSYLTVVRPTLRATCLYSTQNSLPRRSLAFRQLIEFLVTCQKRSIQISDFSFVCRFFFSIVNEERPGPTPYLRGVRRQYDLVRMVCACKK